MSLGMDETNIEAMVQQMASTPGGMAKLNAMMAKMGVNRNVPAGGAAVAAMAQQVRSIKDMTPRLPRCCGRG
jgi:hypothetical protein